MSGSLRQQPASSGEPVVTVRAFEPESLDSAPKTPGSDSPSSRQLYSLTQLDVPAGVNRRIVWPYVFGIVSVHLLSLLVFVPWLFSWTGVLLAWLGLYVFGTLGINLCYHRLLTHRGFECPAWLEHALSILGVCCLQDTPARWVAIHRLHHQYSDEQPDPHSPLVTFLWGHVGWLLVENQEINSVATYERYSRDLLRDPFYFALEKNLCWVWINFAQIVFFFGAAASAGMALGWGWSEALRFGASVLVWGVFLRLVLVWHITWSVNSVTHMWGYRNYETDENSRNNWLVGLWSNGEGWHNNHHADQRSAAHGHHWWELDVTYLTICALRRLGLATNVVTPSDRLVPKSR